MPSILSFDFWRTAPHNTYAIIFLDDGSAQQVSIQTGPVVTNVAPPGTLWAPGDSFLPQMISAGLAGEVVVCIVSLHGYFIWDGTSLFQAGTVSPSVTILDGGRGYTSPPSATVFPQPGTPTLLTTEIEDGSVSLVRVTQPGNGYTALDPNPVVLFSGGGGGTSAVGHAVITNGVLIGISIIYGGTGFTSIPSLVITPVGGGSGATAVVTSISGGVITGVQVLNGGSGYNAGVTITTSGGGGSGAIFAGAIADGVITGVVMDQVGSGYGSAPDVHYSSISGSGASGRAIFENGSVAGVVFDYPSQGGNGYSTPTIVYFSGGNGPASAIIQLMPFGIVGNSIETYMSRLWIADANRILFTAPGSLVDFGNGGGVFQSLDSELRIYFTKLKQANGFLYCIGDASIWYIGNVNTSGNPPVTTFLFQNVDPQVGTTWSATVQNIGRKIVLANTQGVWEVLGGAAQKVSGPIDDLFATLINLPAPLRVTPLNGSIFPSAAPVSLFSQPVYALYLPIMLANVPDEWPAGSAGKRLLLFNGQRWFTATQSFDITFINGVDDDSILFAFGTDGTNLYQLFNTPSSQSQKIVQSRLWVAPEIITEKKAWGLYCLWRNYLTSAALDWTLDNETSFINMGRTFTAPAAVPNVPILQWSRAAGIPSGTTAGMTIGFTMRSNSEDFAVLDILLVAQEYSKRT